MSRGLLRLQNVHAKGFPYEGKLSPQATDEVVQLGKSDAPPPHPSRLPPCHLPLIGEGFWCSKTRKTPRKKVQTNKLGLHLLWMAEILRQLVTNLIPPYQAARTKTPVR